MIVLGWTALCCICTCNRDFSTSPDPAAGYPTTLYPRTAEELDSLKAEYGMNHTQHFCSKLDEYGFPFWNTDCFKNNMNFTPIINMDSVVIIAKNIIVQNNKFTNVCDTSLLVTYNSDNSLSYWIVNFDCQFFENMRVLNTAISVLGDDNGVFMLSGNWYNDIIIPEERYSLKQSKQQIIDDIGGHGFCDDQYNEKLIYPHRQPDCIELRVVWRIAVGTSPDRLYYFYYVDIYSGEIVNIAKLFF